MLKVDKAYKSQAGRVLIHNQMAPDAEGYSFIGRVPNGSSVFYKADGYTQQEEYRITGPWISDGVVYQPIFTDTPAVIGERFMDLLDAKRAYPGKYLSKLEMVDGVPTLSTEAP